MIRSARMRVEDVFYMLPREVVQRIICFHRTAAAEAIQSYWLASASHRGRKAAVALFHDQLGTTTSRIRRAVQPLLPHDVDDYGDDTLYFTRRWNVEAELDACRIQFPTLRYQIQDVESPRAWRARVTGGGRGVYRVHINKRFKKVVTKRARRSLSISC